MATFESSHPWLVVDTSQPGVMRFATVQPSERPRLDAVRLVDIEGLPTFTDALQKYERESGLALRGLDCALAMPGAISGEMLSMARSRWTITRAGLAAVFGKPVTILNDVAARAWAIRSGLMNVETLRGFGQPSLSRPGRYLMLLVEDGVGGCIVDVDRDGHARVLETEAGHLDFAPSNEVEAKLASALRGAHPFVSWERMLTLDVSDAAWRGACPELNEAERHKVQAAVLGRLTVNLMHGYGAWQGVMLTGLRAQRLTGNGNRSSFEASFAARRDFSRLIIGAPVWRIDQREAVLTGAAELLAQSGGGLRAAA